MDKIIVTTPDELGNIFRKVLRAELANIQGGQAKANFRSKEAAAYLGISEATLNRWRVEKAGPPYAKVGSRVLYRKSDLDAWMELCKLKTLDSPA